MCSAPTRNSILSWEKRELLSPPPYLPLQRIFTSMVLEVFVASCLALSALVSSSPEPSGSIPPHPPNFAFVGEGPACEAATCIPFYICDFEGFEHV
mmetsp:Transcript_5770/g.14001  ORF Transcript_5770/g.14001 Transcript_5770/m.14001 type:complete len:96 (-) Transcript_5770:309-596(-)